MNRLSHEQIVMQYCNTKNSAKKLEVGKLAKGEFKPLMTLMKANGTLVHLLIIEFFYYAPKLVVCIMNFNSHKKLPL